MLQSYLWLKIVPTLKTVEKVMNSANRQIISKLIKGICQEQENKVKVNFLPCTIYCSVITIFFLLYSSPIAIWIILNLISIKYDFVDENAIYICYTNANFTTQFNSCLNQVIYFLKNAEFRRIAKSFLKDKSNSI